MTEQIPTMPAFISGKPVFSPEECAKIIALGGAQPAIAGVVQTTVVGKDPNYETGPGRSSSVCFLDLGPETQWIYERISKFAKDANAKSWRFELARAERVQFTCYGENQFYDWHMDMGSKGPSALRKLSMTVQLSAPDDYQGGDLEFMLGHTNHTAPRDQGVITLFPSYVLHRVAPVTGGVRHSLVHWVRGARSFS